MRTQLPSGVMKMSWSLKRRWLCNTVNVLNATELYMLKWLMVILYYVNFTTIKHIF